jgi:LysR family nitrogen assimilation transcriptional regulator
MEIREFMKADFSALHHFLLVAEAGSLSRAALAAAVSQPTLSRQMKRLEEDVRARLFDRTGRGVALTREGRLLLEALRPGFEQLNAARRAVHADDDASNLKQAVLGLPPSIANIMGAKLLLATHERFPKTSLRMIEGFHRPLVDMLYQGQLDFAILYTMVRSAGIQVDPLIDEELCLVVSPRRARQMRTVTLSQLSEFVLSLPSRPHGLRELVEEQAEAHGVKLDIRYELDTSLTLTKQMPATDLAATVLPFSAVYEEVRAGTLAALPIRKPTLSRRLVLAYANNRTFSPGIGTLQRLVRSECEELVRSGVWRGAALVTPGR